MHDHPKGAREDRAITAWDEDECEHAAVLCRVLELHPAAFHVGRADPGTHRRPAESSAK